MPGNFPTINGLDFGYSSIRLKIAGVPFPITGVKDFSYKGALKPGEARGTFAQITSRTTGQYNADGAITFYKSHFAAFWNALNNVASTNQLGPMQQAFDLTAAYSEASTGSAGLVVDISRSCRITEIADQHSEEDGVLTTKCTLHIIQVDYGLPGGGQAVPFNSALFP